MKKILTLLLSAVMVLAMMPGLAFAEDEGTGNVAKIGDIEYTTLQEAVNEVQDGEEIVLLGNVNEQIIIDNGKTLTINLDGHTISNGMQTIILKHGNLTLTGEGEVTETTDNGFGAILVYGSANVNDKDYSVLTVGEQVTLGGYSGIFINPNSNKACGVKINFNGKIVSPAKNTSTPGNAFYINGKIQEKNNYPEITIGKNAEIVATGNESCAVYAAGYADWIINGGSFTGDGCLEIKAGNLNINDGNFYSTNGDISHEPNGNGTSSVGYALAIVNNPAYAGHPNVVVKGGTFNGPVAILDDDDNPDNNNATLSVTGGKFLDDMKDYTEENTNQYLTADECYIVSATEPPHSEGMNTWILNKDTGIYEESYVAPIPPTGGGSYDPLVTAKTEAIKAVEDFVKLSDYDTAEQAVIKDLLAKAKNDINSAKTKEDIKTIEEAIKAELGKVLTIAEKEEAEQVAKDAKIKAGVEGTTIKLTSELVNGKIKLNWTKSKGYKVDYYEVYKSLNQFKGYGTKPYYETKDGSKTWYKNTKELKKGTRYYYKVRGVRVINGEKVYTQYSTKAWRLVK